MLWYPCSAQTRRLLFQLLPSRRRRQKIRRNCKIFKHFCAHQNFRPIPIAPPSTAFGEGGQRKTGAKHYSQHNFCGTVLRAACAHASLARRSSCCVAQALELSVDSVVERSSPLDASPPTADSCCALPQCPAATTASTVEPRRWCLWALFDWLSVSGHAGCCGASK